MSIHTQKINLMTPLIIEILLIYHFQVFLACQTMSYHTHLIFIHQFAASIDAYQYTKNQPHTDSHFWDIAKVSFWSTLGMSRHVWSYTTNWYIWINLLLLWMPTCTKINSIPTLVLEILLIYYLEAVWPYPSMPDHTHLIFMNRFIASIDAYPHTKQYLHTSTHSTTYINLFLRSSRILQSDLSKSFWAITQEENFARHSIVIGGQELQEFSFQINLRNLPWQS